MQILGQTVGKANFRAAPAGLRSQPTGGVDRRRHRPLSTFMPATKCFTNRSIVRLYGGGLSAAPPEIALQNNPMAFALLPNIARREETVSDTSQ
jgi:hypothetical protein